MPRQPRQFLPDMPQHVIQRGNNRHICFGAEQDFATYITYLIEASRKYEVAVHAWVLMTNHVHLLVTPADDQGISRMMQYLGRKYVPYFNRHYGRSGTLWEGRFRSCLVESGRYFLACQRYIELNPVRANIVSDPANYHWSSYHTNALGKPSDLATPHSEYLALGSTLKNCEFAYRKLFSYEIPGELMSDIRYSVNKGLVLGSDLFREQVEGLWGLRVRVGKRGPRSKGMD